MTRNDDWEREVLPEVAAQHAANIEARKAEQAARVDPETTAVFAQRAQALERLQEEVLAEQARLAGPPQPLDGGRDLPAWPAHVLPGWVREHVAATAERLQVPIDLCAQLAVGVLAAIYQGRGTIAVGSWVETLNLYCYCAMHSGAGKSPAEKAIVGPLREWEDQRRLDGADALAMAHALWKAAQKKAKDTTAAYAMGSKSKAELEEAVLEASQPEPRPFRLTVDDVTPERLVQLLAAHHRLALISTEAGLLDTVAGQFAQGRQANIDVYLKAWSGEDIQRDRKGSEGGPESTVVRNALMTVVLTIQPTVVEKYQLTAPELRGRGFFARFMPSVPPSLVGTRTYGDRPPPGSEADTYRDELHRLASAALGWTTPVNMQLDAEAAALFHQWCQAMEDDLAPGRRLAALHDASSKIRSSVLRVAGLLHLAEERQGPWVGPGTISRAIEVGDYWVAHALAVEGTVDPLEGDDAAAARLAKEIIAWSLKRGQRRFTPRDLHRSMRRRVRFVEDFAPALELLRDRRWLFFEEGSVDEIGVKGARVLCALSPAAFTESALTVTPSGRTRTCTGSPIGGEFSPPPPLYPFTTSPPSENAYTYAFSDSEPVDNSPPEDDDDLGDDFLFADDDLEGWF